MKERTPKDMWFIVFIILVLWAFLLLGIVQMVILSKGG
jgi:hypothetical protein